LLDALENLPEEASCPVAFSELQGEVPCVPDQPSARLESAHQRADDADRPEQSCMTRKALAIERLVTRQRPVEKAEATGTE